ncbi:MAG: sigma-70 family RNA polymerase sigma factor [Planctomycetes bacterium]|nr:sigma-70 family RNA polymerase sigma factor [Planctomycetota bacterium]
MPEETSIGGERDSFAPTLWTVVLRARGKSPEALDELIRAYWKPVYFYARRHGSSVEDAKDLTQGFFADFLERDLLQGVAPEKGRFRAYLLTLLKHYLINAAEHARAGKRGGGKRALSLDFASAETQYAREPAAEETLDAYFRRQWAQTVLSRALDRLSAEMDARVFAALKPHLAGGPSYEETAKALGMPATQLNNLIHRTRKRYRELVRAEVAGSVADPSLVEEELAELFAALNS